MHSSRDVREPENFGKISDGRDGLRQVPKIAKKFRDPLGILENVEKVGILEISGILENRKIINKEIWKRNDCTCDECDILF
ncbi:hypothetical protein K0M31_012725 [Melipona bicolor]|uniref:Uncharacterized protein n=1 Tax=Melipona bicolor TaxID=60889 RepID=A0AA40FJB1_9HYME|nr:hypothetical protein K0M31_012725 [Melipona bicolor]